MVSAMPTRRSATRQGRAATGSWHSGCMPRSARPKPSMPAPSSVSPISTDGKDWSHGDVLLTPLPGGGQDRLGKAPCLLGEASRAAF